MHNKYMSLIKLRSGKTGKLYNAEGISFVEIYSTDNKLIGVLSVNDVLKMVELLRPGDLAFYRYKEAFNCSTGELKDVNCDWIERKRKMLL
jgi:hypothetical protein